jgi:hypothetical protein
MSKATAQLVRLRRIEHRLAQAEQARAQARINDLTHISSRLTMLSSTLTPPEGLVRGETLRATAEMIARLSDARTSLTLPFAQAIQAHRNAEAARARSGRNEECARDRDVRATKTEAAIRAIRVDANRPFRRRPPGPGAAS